MSKDRFYEEMERAYIKTNAGYIKRGKQSKDFIVENGPAYYEVCCKAFEEKHIQKQRKI